MSDGPVQAFADGQDLASGSVVAFDQIGDFLAAVHNGRVITPTEGLTDGGQ
jgi:hypothetical protein